MLLTTIKCGITTVQEIVNHVGGHLLAQGAPSFLDSNDGYSDPCAMRSRPDNLEISRSCAIGSLISDEQFKMFSVLNASGLSTWIEALCTTYKDVGQFVPILADLQDIHDHEEPSHWHTKLEVLCRYEKLDFTQVLSAAKANILLDRAIYCGTIYPSNGNPV